MHKFGLILSLVFLFSSCQETKQIYIASHLTDCEGVAPQKCMLIKSRPSEEWSYFYDTIEGFSYEEGYFYELEVAVTRIENPPADGSSLQYSLLKILSKEKDQTVGQNMTHSTPIQQQEVSDIVYEASTRGSFFQIKINKDLIQKTKDRSLKEINSKKCSKEDWDTILSFLKNTPIEKIGDLTPPTDKRATDAALHAKLKIITKTNTYTSIGFDHGNPPDEIKQLVKTILSLSESIE